MSFLKLSFLILFTGQTAFAGVADYFETIKTDPNALYAFLKEMPKGGELHYHLSGGAYPESMLAIAVRGDYCLNKTTFVMSKTIEQCLGIKAADLTQHPSLYEQTIRAWSMKNFIPGEESGHDHFFASFNKFMSIIVRHRPELLAEVMQRAANQNELYLEIMILSDNAQATAFAPKTITPDRFAVIQQNLLANQTFQDNIRYTANEATRFLKEARDYLHCDQAPLQAVCQLTVKFQYYILREQPLEKVFAQALNGFAAASHSNDIVGVNLVQAEDGLIALRDYRQQMQIFNFLHQTYPQVHIALHAGELAPEAVMPEELRFHIHDAIHIGHAERIGHGVDIAFENHSEAILKTMATKQIAVEINLTSNKKILNISGKKHPLPYYLAHHVPIVLSTDDEGILRTDLTRQYVNAVLNYDINYPLLKQINRNALTYSFLPGKSLWQDAGKAEPINACHDLYSSQCLQFVNDNEKARLQRKLEIKLVAFEQGIEKVPVPAFKFNRAVELPFLFKGLNNAATH